jgi:hypothetical protein
MAVARMGFSDDSPDLVQDDGEAFGEVGKVHIRCRDGKAADQTLVSTSTLMPSPAFGNRKSVISLR